MNVFDQKVVWITGASSGIGKELAVQLDQLGAKLILSSRKEEELTAVQKQLSKPERHLVFPLDLMKNDAYPVLVEKIISHYGRLDYLFNSGGVSQRGNAFDTSIEVDRRIMEINYFGNIALTKAVLPIFRKQSSGHIIVTSSIAGKFGFFLRSAYSASKHALHGYYESLQLEEAPNGIHVTIVCPGKILTPISLNALNSDGKPHGVMDHNQETGMPVEECVAKMLKATSKCKKEVLIGNKEILAVYIKRYFPALFRRIIKKQSAT